jgi:hypothetical protein
MKFGLDWNDPATWRGAALVPFSALAFWFLANKELLEAGAVLAAGQQVAGWIGLLFTRTIVKEVK